jgi:hypothetical protein
MTEQLIPILMVNGNIALVNSYHQCSINLIGDKMVMKHGHFLQKHLEKQFINIRKSATHNYDANFDHYGKTSNDSTITA